MPSIGGRDLPLLLSYASHLLVPARRLRRSPGSRASDIAGNMSVAQRLYMRSSETEESIRTRVHRSNLYDFPRRRNIG